MEVKCVSWFWKLGNLRWENFRNIFERFRKNPDNSYFKGYI